MGLEKITSKLIGSKVASSAEKVAGKSLLRHTAEKAGQATVNTAKKVGTGIAETGKKIGNKAKDISYAIKNAPEARLNAEADKIIKEARGTVDNLENKTLDAIKKQHGLGTFDDDIAQAIMRNEDPEVIAGIQRNIQKHEIVKGKLAKQAQSKASAKKGGLLGAAAGAGIGGGIGIATGADEDNMKAMVLTGALAGGAGGALIGGGKKIMSQRALTKLAQSGEEVAADIASGGANKALNGGAKGFLSGAGAKVQSLGDKIDDIGESVSRTINNKSYQKAASEIGDIMDVNDLSEAMNVMSNVSTKKGNIIGGAVSGSMSGAIGGAVLGGISGVIDEDQSIIGGATKGMFVGGALGAVGGGASGYFNNSAKALSNTTTNVKSLIGKS